MLYYVVLTIVIISIIYFIACIVSINKEDKQIHHDSRKGSFYEISNRKDKWFISNIMYARGNMGIYYCVVFICIDKIL